nr:unnamed protein product [Callosobruchus chinensis]
MAECSFYKNVILGNTSEIAAHNRRADDTEDLVVEDEFCGGHAEEQLAERDVMEMHIAILVCNKICLWIYTAVIFSSQCCRASPPLDPIRAPLEIISLNDVTPEQRRQIALSGVGSTGFLIKVASTIGKGLGAKVGQVALASATAGAAAIGGFSMASSQGKGSSKPKYYHHHPPQPHRHDDDCHYDHVPESYEHHPPKPSFDWWSVKKSLLNTILQVVKAIKGSGIAIAGQLVKGSGKLVSASGKLVSYKGETITKLGKNIASSAVLVPFGSKHPPSGHGDYGHSAPSAPEAIYHHPPSAPAYHESYPPHGSHYDHHHHDDIVVVKIPHHHHHDHDYHDHHDHHEESKTPPISITHTGPSYTNILGKLFQASLSSNPSQPQLYGHTATGEGHYAETPPPPSSQHLEVEHKLPLEPTKHTYQAESPVSNSYGVPFEQEPSYLHQHLDDYYVSASKDAPVAVKPGKYLQPPRNSITVSETGKDTSSSGLDLSRPFSSEQDSDHFDVANDTDSQHPLRISTVQDLNYLYDTLNPKNPKKPVQFPSFSEASKVPHSDTSKPALTPLEEVFDYGAPDLSGKPFLIAPGDFDRYPYLHDGSGSKHNVDFSRNQITSSPSPYLQVPKKQDIPPQTDSTALNSGGLNSGQYDVVRSVAYEIGPDGPKRLTGKQGGNKSKERLSTLIYLTVSLVEQKYCVQLLDLEERNQTFRRQVQKKAICILYINRRCITTTTEPMSIVMKDEDGPCVCLKN